MKMERMLIVESGSSKTDWKLVSEAGVEKSYESVGINPVMQSVEQIADAQQQVLHALASESILEVNFYGAGCGSDATRKKVTDAIKSGLGNVKVEVESDLVAAGRSLFGDGSGIACILGTGSNSCFFESGKVVKNVPSLGYLLGDEGGGTQIGKRLMVDYLRKDMPENVAKDTTDFLKMEVVEIYDQLYSKPFPNRFLAGLVAFLAEKYGDQDYFYGLVYAEFSRFFANCLSKYNDHISNKTKIGFVGSIAYHFGNILMDVAEAYDYKIYKVVKKPIEELVEVHRLKMMNLS